ncbi:LysR substrate-binding domain-containing protein [Sphingomonas oryzagri]|uniref:LysR substrate-binding domain-containing protein n=1 Tax=Sphingomonas oryzagri TaxID=3042314 RepID=A0ABT6N1X0_9SPHN|nr:LysR substrate-binding domain-containing protein [Sphingomonas oryzagri]MDH7639294.1 LysR substrate-binding domain-containing protein [Sphingomonas oryzagri]
MATALPADRFDEISFRQLRILQSISDVKSVRGASDACNISQPGLTQSLAKLERRVGCELVSRGSQRSVLNDLGAIFLKRVNRLFDQAEAALRGFTGAKDPDDIRSRLNRLSRSQLRSLIYLAESASFADAARLIGIAPATLQRSVRDIELNLRRPLVNRSSSGLLMIPQAVDFARGMKLALQEIGWGLHEIRTGPGDWSSSITIGSMPSGGTYLLSAALNEFAARRAECAVQVVVESSASLVRSLRAGDVDLIVGTILDNEGPDLASRPFARTPYVIVGRQGHPLARADNVGVEDLAAHDWLVGARGSSRRKIFDTLLGDRTASCSRIEISALPGLRTLLASSDRLALMTSFEIDQDMDGLSVVPFPVPPPAPYIGVTMRANWLPTRSHEEFVQIIQRYALLNVMNCAPATYGNLNQVNLGAARPRSAQGSSLGCTSP